MAGIFDSGGYCTQHHFRLALGQHALAHVAGIRAIVDEKGRARPAGQSSPLRGDRRGSRFMVHALGLEPGHAHWKCDGESCASALA